LLTFQDYTTAIDGVFGYKINILVYLVSEESRRGEVASWKSG
jgi:hypothetical protein